VLTCELSEVSYADLLEVQSAARAGSSQTEAPSMDPFWSQVEQVCQADKFCCSASCAATQHLSDCKPPLLEVSLRCLL
jgi:hypothetical protein